MSECHQSFQKSVRRKKSLLRQKLSRNPSGNGPRSEINVGNLETLAKNGVSERQLLFNLLQTVWLKPLQPEGVEVTVRMLLFINISYCCTHGFIIYGRPGTVAFKNFLWTLTFKSILKFWPNFEVRSHGSGSDAGGFPSVSVSLRSMRDRRRNGAKNSRGPGTGIIIIKFPFLAIHIYLP